MSTWKSMRVVLFFLLASLSGLLFAAGLMAGQGDCQNAAGAECDHDFDDALSLVPHNYDFGGVPVNTEAQPMSYALVNTSGGAVRVGIIAVSGEGMAVCMAIGCPSIADGEFFLLADDCSGKTLAEQESCELEVGFLPSGEGEFLSGLWVPYTPAGGQPQTLRGKLAGAGYLDQGGGFRLSGAIYLFDSPSPEEILAGIREGAQRPTVEQGRPPAEPKARTWQPVEGVTVTLDNGLSTTTNELGEYSFEGLQPGTYTITPSSEAHRFFPAVRHTRINGRDRQGVQFRARELPASAE
jgi:hypothetical protein